MKKIIYIFLIGAVILGCSSKNKKDNVAQSISQGKSTIKSVYPVMV